MATSTPLDVCWAMRLLGLQHSNQPNYQLSPVYFPDRRSFPGWAAIWDSSVTLGCWILHVPWICAKTYYLLSSKSPNHVCLKRAVGVWERHTYSRCIWPWDFRQSWKQCKGRKGGGLTVVYTRRTSCEGLRSMHRLEGLGSTANFREEKAQSLHVAILKIPVICQMAVWKILIRKLS